MEKRALREAAFRRLRALSAEEKRDFSRRMTIHLRSDSRWSSAGTVFSYLPLASEPDLMELHREFPDKQWGFSRVDADGERIVFHAVERESHLREGNFGFLEPDPRNCPEIDTPDLILVPGVAFCPDNLARLGRGKGHYDRFLSSFPREGKRPSVIGVCFTTQLGDLEPEEHDVAMDALLTESGWIPAVSGP